VGALVAHGLIYLRQPRSGRGVVGLDAANSLQARARLIVHGGGGGEHEDIEGCGGADQDDVSVLDWKIL